MSRDQILPIPEKIYLQVALSGSGQAIASGTKKGVVPVPVAGTITAFRVDCDPANEPSAASIEVDLNTINRSTGTATSILSSVASIAIGAMKSIISEWIALNIPSDVRGFPATIIGGTDIGISLEIVDSSNDPITEIFGESVDTVEWLFGMGTSARRARILGSVEWVSDLLEITIDRNDTLAEEDGARTWMIGVKLTSGEIKWVKTGVTRLIGRQFAEPTTTTTGA